MGKVIRRVIAGLLIVTALILTFIPSADAQATTERGDFSMNGSTLVKYTGNDVEVTLPNSITAIGDDAFSGNNNILKVTIPDSVKSIGHAAFENCQNLQNVYIGTGVKSIGSIAFSSCKSLSSVNIPAKCSELGNGVFAGCNSLSSVGIPAENRFYTCIDGVIYTKDGSKLIQYLAGRPSSIYQMPAATTTVGAYAFWGADSLTGAKVSPGVKEIPEYAFSNCASLSKVSLPTSVESLMAFSFADCPNLDTIVIPSSVGYIDDKAFYMTTGAKLDFTDPNGGIEKEVLVSDVLDETMDNPGNDSGEVIESSPSDGIISQWDIENSVKQDRPDGYTPSYSGDSNWMNIINDRDFSNNLKEDDLGSGMIVGGNAFFIMPSNMPVRSGYDLNEAEAEDSLAASGGNTSMRGDVYDIINGVLANYNGGDASAVVPGDVNVVGERAFYKKSNLSNVALPDNLNKISDFAFARSGLTSVQIPIGVGSVGYAAFYHCENLEEVLIPASVNNIELGAFDGTAWLENWKAADDGSSYLVVGDGILIAYKGEGGNISIPSEVKQIGAGCFEGNTSITGVTIPSSVFKIGEDAFSGCSAIKNVTLNEGLSIIEDRAFAGTDISALQIPDSVTSIGLGAFDTTTNRGSLKTVMFQGNDVPNVSYKDTATRLSARTLRNDAFNGVDSVIVKPNTNIDSGTLFNPLYYGFHGQIYEVSGSATNEAVTLSLLKTTKKPDYNGNVNINSHVFVNDHEYVMDSVKEHAFDDYLNYSKWCDNMPTSVSVTGNTSDDLNTLLQSIINQVGFAGETSGIKVVLEGEHLNGSGTASIEGFDESATLTISEDESNKDAIMTGLYNYYGPDASVTMLPLEINLFDKTGTLPIKKLGDAKMDVVIDLPSKFSANDSVLVASLDENGSLTELPTGIHEYNGANYLSFVANHCSKYAIYIKNQTTRIMPVDNTDDFDELTDSNMHLEETISVDMESATSDGNNIGVMNVLTKHSGVFGVRFFVIIILICMAVLLFIYKPRKINKQ